MSDKSNETTMTNPPPSSSEDEAKLAKETRKKKRKRMTSAVVLFFSLVFLCGWETLLLKNIPLLISVLLFFGGLSLIQWRVMKIFSPGWKQAVVFLVGIYAYIIAFAGLMNLLPVTVISEKTTYLTEPRTANGKSLDLARAVAERFLPDCPPEQNGFRSVVETFGFSQVVGRLPEKVHDDVCRRLYAELDLDSVPQKDDPPAVRFESVYAFFEKDFEEKINAASENDADPEGQIAVENKSEKADDPTDDVRHLAWEAVNQLHHLPWPEEHREKGLHWLAENDAAFDAFGKAIRMPEYFVPFFQDNANWYAIEEWSGYDEFHREMARCLWLRMLHRLEQGDLDGAKYDLLTINRLAAKMMRHPHSDIGLTIGAAVKDIAVQATLDMLHYGNLNGEQLASLQEELRESYFLFSQSDVVFLMRVEGMQGLYFFGSGNMFLADFENVSHSQAADKPPTFENYLLKYLHGSMSYVAWTPVFQNFNEQINVLEKIAEMPLSPEQLRQLDRDRDFGFESQLWDPERGLLDFSRLVLKKGVICSISSGIGLIASNLTFDSYYPWSLLRVYRDESQSRMLEIAFALERYALDHDGTYPETLDALTGEYIAQLPTDPCTDGEMFRYRLQEIDGRPGYVLYGIGVNMQDDKGLCGSRIDPETEEEYRGDDCVIEMPRR